MPDSPRNDDSRWAPPKPGVNGQDSAASDVTARVNPAPSAPSTVSLPYVNRNYTTMPPPPPPTRGSAARDRMRRRRVRPRNRGSEWAWVVIAVAMLAVVIVVSMSLTLLLRTSNEAVEVMPTAMVSLPTPVDGRVDFSNINMISDGQPITLDDGRSIVLEPWDGQSRFTVLLMGLDRRPEETGLTYRTDTMMLASIDPATDSIGILSIPRDLYVEVPGYNQLQRINSPMVLGELQQPGYGPRLTMQTVQYNLGIRVHDYVIVDFRAVITLIDYIGGIDVDVPYNISDPQYPNMWYGYDPFYINAGIQHLNGATALKYARTRHGSSDFQRAERQQQVMYAVRDKILNAEMLPQLIIQMPSLLSNLDESIYTGLSVDQIIQLAWYLKDIDASNISTGVLAQGYVSGYTTPQGAQVLIPNRSTIGSLMVEVFGQNYSE
jgi:LCP family protein required for cell wall assembly